LKVKEKEKEKLPFLKDAGERKRRGGENPGKMQREKQ